MLMTGVNCNVYVEITNYHSTGLVRIPEKVSPNFIAVACVGRPNLGQKISFDHSHERY